MPLFDLGSPGGNMLFGPRRRLSRLEQPASGLPGATNNMSPATFSQPSNPLMGGGNSLMDWAQLAQLMFPGGGLSPLGGAFAPSPIDIPTSPTSLGLLSDPFGRGGGRGPTEPLFANVRSHATGREVHGPLTTTPWGVVPMLQQNPKYVEKGMQIIDPVADRLAFGGR